jgi:hypothetical protein
MVPVNSKRRASQVRLFVETNRPSFCSALFSRDYPIPPIARSGTQSARWPSENGSFVALPARLIFVIDPVSSHVTNFVVDYLRAD